MVSILACNVSFPVALFRSVSSGPKPCRCAVRYSQDEPSGSYAATIVHFGGRPGSNDAHS
jgi:hypothetical protein